MSIRMERFIPNLESGFSKLIKRGLGRAPISSLEPHWELEEHWKVWLKGLKARSTLKFVNNLFSSVLALCNNSRN